MCWAVRFQHNGQQRQVCFQHASARLPVSSRKGAQILLLPWGRRPREAGRLPAGGWAKLTHIHSGVWDKFEPRPVKLPVSAFMERDVTGREQWFEVTRGHYIQGLYARVDSERRIYVVTLETSPEESEFERWPRILSAAVEHGQRSAAGRNRG